ncbi:MAG TPA: YccF domain-containing protein, partial [Actinomycetes bacterium]
MLRAVGNILWLAFSGFWMALGYVVAGAIACVLIVTIPFGIASFRLAGYALWPFGRTVVWKPSAGAASTVGNVLWLILFGWWLALGQIVA